MKVFFDYSKQNSTYFLSDVFIFLPFSLRWVFKQLYDKGLVYRGVKVMPYSTACNTPLSNFESHQNYKVGSCLDGFLSFLESSITLKAAMSNNN